MTTYATDGVRVIITANQRRRLGGQGSRESGIPRLRQRYVNTRQEHTSCVAGIADFATAGFGKLHRVEQPPGES
jgi:hypothetical protein